MNVEKTKTALVRKSVGKHPFRRTRRWDDDTEVKFSEVSLEDIS